MKKLLIANRGEIALRIVRACRELGIKTVAAHTQIDSTLKHLELADETVCIGKVSYIDATQLLAAAISRGCDAVHPGYGFLSENVDFAAQVEAEDLMFVGPTAEQIGTMGNKAMARQVLRAAGVPVFPGSEGELSDVDELLSVAGEISYPVMIKASHGGGGRDIAIANNDSELRQAHENVVAQAKTLFGNGAVYVEKYLEHARHIEIQVFGDGAGRVIHFGARECSIQRFHQKLLEEAPPVGLSSEQLEDLATRCCLALARLNYRNAGTLEFLYRQGEFFFIEMNTRIQVEHPITECISGIDLVKLQLHVASQGSLNIRQEDIKFSGHAIECRINAEDEQFVPCPGRVTGYRVPGGPGIRIESHLFEGL